MDGAGAAIDVAASRQQGVLVPVPSLGGLQTALKRMNKLLATVLAEINLDDCVTDIDVELGGELKFWVDVMPSKQPTIDQFDNFCSLCERLIEKKPRLKTMDRIRKILVSLIYPMRLVEILKDVQDSPVPRSVSDLAQAHLETSQSYDSLDETLWNAGKLGAREAEAILARKVNGTFLVRVSSTSHGDYAVTVRNSDTVYHFRIVQTEAEFYVQSEETFSSLSELVHHYGRSSRRDREDTAKFPTRLLCPFAALDSNPWFHGDIDKATSEDLLHLANVGSFLVRRKLSSRADTDTLTLSLKADKDAVRHIRILHDAGGYSVSKNVHFASVEKLIHFYARNQGGNFPRLQRGLVRDTAADDAPNPIFEYVNLVAEAKGSAVTPTVCLGSGFGQCGFYQRRWLLSLQGNSYK